MDKKCNTYLEMYEKISFGDYLLFQEYKMVGDDYEVSKPILVIYLGSFVADQTIGFHFVRWVNENHKNVGKIEFHVDWTDHIDILGHWTKKPNWKEIMGAYRNKK